MININAFINTDDPSNIYLNVEDPSDLCELLMDLHEGLGELVERSGSEALPPAVALLFHGLEADSAMNNEGAAELADGAVAVAALEKLGASQQANLLTLALKSPDDAGHLDAWALHVSDLEGIFADWIVAHAADFLGLS